MGQVRPDAERRVAENHRIRLSVRDRETFAKRRDAAPRQLPEPKEPFPG